MRWPWGFVYEKGTIKHHGLAEGRVVSGSEPDVPTEPQPASGCVDACAVSHSETIHKGGMIGNVFGIAISMAGRRLGNSLQIR